MKSYRQRCVGIRNTTIAVYNPSEAAGVSVPMLTIQWDDHSCSIPNGAETYKTTKYLALGQALSTWCAVHAKWECVIAYIKL